MPKTITAKDVRIVRCLFEGKRPSLTNERILLALQFMLGHKDLEPNMSLPELARLTGKTRYLVEKTLKEKGLQPCATRPSHGGPQNLYCSADALAALGYDKPEVVGEAG